MTRFQPANSLRPAKIIARQRLAASRMRASAGPRPHHGNTWLDQAERPVTEFLPRLITHHATSDCAELRSLCSRILMTGLYVINGGAGRRFSIVICMRRGNADSALEDCRVQVSRAACILAIPARGLSSSRSLTGPADQQLPAR